MHRRNLNLGLVVGKKSIQEDASIGSKSRIITIPGADRMINATWYFNF